MAEDYTRDSEEQKLRSHEVEDILQSSYDLQAQGLGAALHPPPPILLGKAGLIKGRGFSPVRAGVIQRAQQAYGNRAVQRYADKKSEAEGGDEQEELSKRIQKASAGGAPVDTGVRERLQEGLGSPLGDVRIHTGSDADKLAREVESVAFTSGQDIFFREGMYNPATPDGVRLLAHELTHTVQQAQGPVEGTASEGGVSISDPNDRFEQAAERAAEFVVAGLKRPLEEEELLPAGILGRKAVQRTSVQRYLLPSMTVPEPATASSGQPQAEDDLGRLIGGVGGALGGAYGDAGQMLGSGVSTVTGALGGAFGRGTSRIGAAGARGGATAGDMISGAAGLAGRGASRIGSVLGSGVSGIENMLGLGTGIGADISGIGSTVGGGISAAGNVVDDLVTQGAAGLGGLYGTLGTMAGDAFSQGGAFAGGNIERNMRRMGDYGAGVASDIGNAVSNFDTDLLLM